MLILIRALIILILRKCSKMSFTITAACRACGKCARHCPANAIALSGSFYQIDQEKCINCGKCISICPVGAITTGSSGTDITPPASHNPETDSTTAKKGSCHQEHSQHRRMMNFHHHMHHRRHRFMHD